MTKEVIHIKDSCPDMKFPGWTVFHYTDQHNAKVIRGGICTFAELQKLPHGTFITTYYEITESGMPKDEPS